MVGCRTSGWLQSRRGGFKIPISYQLFQLEPESANTEPQIDLLTETLEPMIQRELVHRGFLVENRGYNVGWVEVV
jgi:hypothetical protein